MGLNISNMKKIILAALVVASLFASCSSEKTFKKNGIKYK
nr:MAG TPA: outer membrane protein assembly factor [Caudoviricetes sp.]